MNAIAGTRAALLGGLAAAALFFSGSVLPSSPESAEAQPVNVQDGLVNVAIGDVTIAEDVNIGVAALIAANVCDVDVGPVAVLGRAVDRSGEEETVCEVEDGTVTIEQN
jgi:hypothetical protein